MKNRRYYYPGNEFTSCSDRAYYWTVTNNEYDGSNVITHYVVDDFGNMHKLNRANEETAIRYLYGSGNNLH